MSCCNSFAMHCKYSLIIYISDNTPESFQMTEGCELSIFDSLPVETILTDGDSVKVQSTSLSLGKEYKAKLKILGIIPVTDTTVKIVDKSYVQLLGQAFGIKIYADGVMVVGISDVETAQGLQNPSRTAGIQIGDIIISIDGLKVESNADVSEIIKSSEGNRLLFKIKRNGTIMEKTVQAVRAVDDSGFKIGLWVRDSSAGIGTLTFYNPSNGVICGLGHAICDADTGELIPLNHGEFVGAEVIGVIKGNSGTPGELKGRFTGTSLGSIIHNSVTGVYAKYSSDISFYTGDYVPIANKQEITTGDALIYTTVDNQDPKFYKCKIDKIHFNDRGLTQNLIIEITDPDLIEKTGGIVQGMSGSPIVQNGKLVGAVTHVFVNNSKKGYAIFAENMLNASKKADQNTDKKAS
ncbi:MAG: SpoIVB peptidase [bacterium]|nr:SpoIVB peptidase [bacterium]